ncbi:MAG TPA: hypothetical protein PKX87_08110, partial [Alphaproteobacteria bacterium]|nr:hypothetical protein [Alphaproteobacteria bacterium]
MFIGQRLKNKYESIWYGRFLIFFHRAFILEAYTFFTRTLWPVPPRVESFKRVPWKWSDTLDFTKHGIPMGRNALQEIRENKDELTRPADPPSQQKKKVEAPSADTAQGQTFHRTLTVNGVQRTYDIYVPNSVAEKLRTEGLDNVNTIMGFHGTGGRSDRTVGGNLNLAEVANRTGSILIAPQALGQNDPSAPDDPNKNPSHWHIDGHTQKGPPVDDAAFLKSIQADAEDSLRKKYGKGQGQEEFGKIDEVTPIGMSNGSVMAADVAFNPRNYLREGTTIKGGAFVTATQEVELHEGNTPRTPSGEQLFVSGLQD